MEFSFKVNAVLTDEITQVDSRLQPCRQYGIDRYGFKQLQTMLYEIVDKMGDASAKAQGLHGSITTGKKLELAGHRLYIMKDSNSDKYVVGILKVGTKKLFVYDQLKQQHEVDALCVLDFYVHESRQRMGCGRKLFEFMLRSESITADSLAIDRPSPKFLSFLHKHYKLRATIPQVNNFVIFEGFFNHIRGSSRNRRGAAINGARTSPLLFNGTSSSGHQNSSPFNRNQSSPQPYWNNRTSLSGPRNNNSPGRMHGAQSPIAAVNGGQDSSQKLGANDLMYSRHRTPPSNGYFSSLQGDAGSNMHRPQGYYNLSNSPSGFNHHLGLTAANGLPLSGDQGNLPPRPPVQRSAYPGQIKTPGLDEHPRGVASTPNFGNRSRTNGSLYSTGVSPSPSVNGHQNGLSSQSGAVTHLPQLPNSQSGANGTGQHAAGNHPNHSSQNTPDIPVNHRPPSGKKVYNNHRGDTSEPPLLQRNGLPADYTNMLNLHHNYQGRSGHLHVQTGSPTVQSPGAGSDRANIQKSSLGGGPPHSNTSWTVMGVLRNQQINNTMGTRYYNRGRLW